MRTTTTKFTKTKTHKRYKQKIANRLEQKDIYFMELGKGTFFDVFYLVEFD